jgi:hypothetical protein
MYFFNLTEYVYLEQREPISTFKKLHCQKYSFQNLTKFSQENYVRDGMASNTNGVFFFDRYMCFFNSAE